MRYSKLVLGLAAVALAIAVTRPGAAAPFSTGAATLKNFVPNDVVDVRWRGRGWAWGGAGFATGLAIGSLAARPYYYGYYGPPPAYYAPAPVYPAPTYVEPAPDPNGPVRQCWI